VVASEAGSAVMGLESVRLERRIDGAVHALGVGAALVGVAMLLHAVLATHDARAMLAASVYSAGALAMFGFSAAYHLLARKGRREILRRCDHAAIFVMIAGSYTPFALISVGGTLGLGLLALVWLIAIGGVVLKLLRPHRIERVSIALYLALGWIGLPAVGAVIAVLPLSALVLLGAGAVLYTAGVAFHLWRSLAHHNAIWHSFVLAAAACHYVAVLAALGVA
jgi:hemolysin III